MGLIHRMLSSLLSIAVSVWLLLCLGMFLLQPRFVYFPSRVLDATPREIGLAHEDIIIKKPGGGQIHGWYIAHPEGSRTVLVFHGNGGNISHRLHLVQIFHELKFNVFLVDYSGYGKSDGAPSEQGTYEDAEASWEYLTRQRGVDGRRIVIYGESLGGAVATYLASRVSPGALILQSTFSSMAAVGSHLYPYLPVRWLLRIRYPTIDRIGDIRCPILIAHGPRDEIIPYQQGQALFAAAREPKTFLELQGHHNDAVVESEQAFLASVGSFLTAHP